MYLFIYLFIYILSFLFFILETQTIYVGLPVFIKMKYLIIEEIHYFIYRFLHIG